MQKKLVKSPYLSSFGTYSGVHAFSRTDSATTKLTLDFRDVTAVHWLGALACPSASAHSLY